MKFPNSIILNIVFYEIRIHEEHLIIKLLREISNSHYENKTDT